MVEWGQPKETNWDRLKNFVLRRKIVQDTTVIHELPPEAAKKIEKKILEENAQLKAERALYIQKLKSFQLKQQAELEKAKVYAELLEQEKRHKLLKQQKALKLVFALKEKDLPHFLLKNNRTYMNCRLKGIILQEVDDGRTLFSPLLVRSDPKGGSQELKFKFYTGSFLEWFKEADTGLVSRLYAGKADTNFALGKKSEPMLLNPFNYDAETEKGDKVRVVELNLSAQQKEEYEKRIEDYKSGYSELRERLKQAQNREVIMQHEIDQTELDMGTVKKERDVWASSFAAQAEKVPKLVKDVAVALLSVQDLATKSVLSEHMVNDLLNHVEQTQSKFNELMATGYEGMADERLREDLQTSIKYVRELSEVAKDVAKKQAQPQPTPG